MTTNLASYNNEWYQPGSFLKRGTWFVLNLLFIRSAIIPVYSFKVWLLQLFGASIGTGVIIKPGVSIKYPWLLRIGNHSWIGEQVWIDNLAMVTIGSHVCISQGALLLCGNHDYRSASFDLLLKPVVLEDGVWIGAKAMVCPGVTCCSHAVLTAGSIATQSLEAYGIYQGNPCVKVRERVMGNIQ